MSSSLVAGITGPPNGEGGLGTKETLMSVLALGYMGVRTKSVADWADYGPRHLGLQRIDKTRASLAFRMDDRSQRIIVNETNSDGVDFFGWEVADSQSLDELGARLQTAKISVTRGDRALAEERHVADLFLFQDPSGNRLEAFYGPEIATEPFRPGRSISGFRTGSQGLGHVVFGVENGELVDRMLLFYRDLLGFRLTDYYDEPFPARFLHVNRRHHSLAFVNMGKSLFHHLMMELYSFDDVGQGLDIAIAEDKVATSLGRHCGDFMTSFYSQTPSKFMVEYGWGGQTIDPDGWEPYERKTGPSLWGHERNWTTPEVSKNARALAADNANRGLRAPVQVIEGNYRLSEGICPWWDSLKGGSKKPLLMPG
jgi:2,3-dihydroxybiphenyl 1,2-dioxygenase